jgi:hypothetical protein
VAYVVSFADQISKGRGQPSTVRVGTVVSVAPLIVSLQATDMVGCGSLTPNLAAGDVVALLGQSAVSADGSSWLVLGPVTLADQVTTSSSTGIQVMASAQSNNTGVFVNITGVSFTFIKRRANSRVLMHLAGSGFSTVAAAVGEYAALITSSTGVPAATDNVLASFFYNAANTHASWSGFRYLTGLPAGTYTIQGRFRLSAGASFISFDVNDRISLGFTEVD